MLQPTIVKPTGCILSSWQRLCMSCHARVWRPMTWLGERKELRNGYKEFDRKKQTLNPVWHNRYRIANLIESHVPGVNCGVRYAENYGARGQGHTISTRDRTCVSYQRDLAKDYALPKPSLWMRWQRTAECRWKTRRPLNHRTETQTTSETGWERTRKKVLFRNSSCLSAIVCDLFIG